MCAERALDHVMQRVNAPKHIDAATTNTPGDRDKVVGAEGLRAVEGATSSGRSSAPIATAPVCGFGDSAGGLGNLCLKHPAQPRKEAPLERLHCRIEAPCPDERCQQRKDLRDEERVVAHGGRGRHGRKWDRATAAATPSAAARGCGKSPKKERLEPDADGCSVGWARRFRGPLDRG